MEKRVVLLVVLSVAVFFGWSLLMRAISPPQPVKPDAAPATAPVTAPAPKDPAPPAADARQADEPERVTHLANDKVELTLTNKGAGIRKASVKIQGQPDMPLLKPFSFDPTVPHLAVSAEGSGDDTARTGWSGDRKSVV